MIEQDKQFRSAKNYALRLIKFRVRSQKEVRDKLKRRDYSPETVEKVVESLKKAGLLDDALFAKLWVTSRVKRPFGFARLSYELKSKGIDKDLIEETFSHFRDNYREEDVIREIVARKIKNMKHLAPDKIKSRLYGFLMRRGYSRSLIMEVLTGLAAAGGQFE